MDLSLFMIFISYSYLPVETSDTHKKTKCQGIKGLGEISYRIGCRFLKIHSRCPGRISVGAFSIACICFFLFHLLISIKQTFFFFILCCLFAWAHKYFIGIFQKKKRKPLRFFWLIKNNVICHERDFISKKKVSLGWALKRIFQNHADQSNNRISILFFLNKIVNQIFGLLPPR